MDEDNKYLTVAQLIEELQKLDQDTVVNLNSTCCGCSGTVTEVKVEPWGQIYIVG